MVKVELIQMMKSEADALNHNVGIKILQEISLDILLLNIFTGGNPWREIKV